MNKILLFFILKYQSNWDKVYNALEKRELVNEEDLKNVNELISCNYVSIIDDDYPNYLKKVYKPSFIIFYHGDLAVVKQKLFAFEGELTNKSKNILTSNEIREFGNIIINGENASDSLLKFLVKTNCKFAIVFNDITSKKAKKTIDLLHSMNKINWVVISENFGSKCLSKSVNKDFFRMIFPAEETVVLSNLSSIKNLDEKISFCKKEKIKILNILERKPKEKNEDENKSNIINVYDPADIKVFVSYKN